LTDWPTAPSAVVAFLHPAQAPDEIGRLGRFRVRRVIGQGGMGIVLLADDLQLGRTIALKVLKPENAVRTDARERFLREARALAAVTHGHIIPIHDVGEAPDRDGKLIPFLVMPLLQGESLGERLARGRLPLREAVRIGLETARGLAAAHAAGLIHRDIKPDNLFLSHEDGGERVRILDFGLARPANDESLTTPGTVIGTPAYLSPEQANGLVLDARSDLFSLGAVLYHALAGVQPFTGNSLLSVLMAVAEQAPPPLAPLAPEAPLGLVALIERLLAKEPAERPMSAAAVVTSLAGFARPTDADPTQTLPSVTPAPPASIPWRAGALLGVLLAVLLTLVGWWGTRPNGVVEAPAPVPVVETPAVAAAELQLLVDAVVWSTDGDLIRRQRLSEPTALPLRNGAQLRISAQTTTPAYVYLLWVDSAGVVQPLYPWTPGQWEGRDDEQPIATLELPSRANQGYRLHGTGAGQETLLGFARTTPLSVSEEWHLRRAVEAIGPQQRIAAPTDVAWFENGKLVRHDAQRTRALTIDELDDPTQQVHGQLHTAVQALQLRSAALSFARLER
jgi:hypothetical protein